MATCATYWPTAAAGVISAADILDRQMYEVKTHLAGVTTVFLTRDGLSGGTTLFKSTSCPDVMVIVQESGDAGAEFGYTGFFGPLLAQTQPNFRDQYQVELAWTGSCWRVQIFLIGSPQITTLADTQGGGRVATVLALGEDTT